MRDNLGLCVRCRLMVRRGTEEEGEGPPEHSWCARGELRPGAETREENLAARKAAVEEAKRKGGVRGPKSAGR